MLYRHKLLLAIHQSFGPLMPVELQKYLFLMTRLQVQPAYDFIPHKYGCFSFQAENDMLNLAKQGLIQAQDKHSVLSAYSDFIAMLKPAEQQSVKKIHQEYKHLRGNDLVKRLYQEYPYFATRSIIAPQLLSRNELDNIEKHRPSDTSFGLFSIGYEGISIDGFIAKLIHAGIRHVCDVRNNPFSMKFDFCKKRLQDYLDKADISYSHHPDLGIQSQDRKMTQQSQNWDALFRQYQENLYGLETETQQVIALLKKHQRIALMCFESHHQDCHRSRLAAFLNNKLPPDYQIIHL